MSATAQTVTVVNPATEEPIAELPQAGAEDAELAVAAARAAFPAWRAVSPNDRVRLLRRLAALVEEHGEELALLETRNVGKPISDSRGEVGMVADVFHFYSGAIDKHHGQSIPVAGGVDVTFHEPLGVVGLITPWNFPIAIASWKLGPALACGNTIVLKPAELTPLTALRLGELALEAGIPEGVLNVVVGPGRVVGQQTLEAIRQLRDVAIANEIAGGAILDDIWYAAVRSADDRLAVGHGFKEYQAEPFPAAGERKDVAEVVG